MYLLLLRLRSRAYALSTASVLMRHWQIALLLALLIPAGMPLPSLLRGLAFPVTALLAPGHGLLWHLGYAALLQGTALTWAMIQRHALSGGRFVRYAASLPVSITLRRCVNISLLFLVDSLLLVPIAFALALSFSPLGQINHLFEVVVLGNILILVLVTQLAALEGNVTAWPGILAATGLLCTGLTLSGDFIPWLLLALAPVSAVAFTFVGRSGKIRRLSAIRAPGPQTESVRPANWISPALRIEFQALLLNQPSATATRMSATLTIAVMTSALIRIFQFDGRSLPAAIIAIAVIAMILSGFYRTLRSIHAPMQAYLATLPLGRHYWAIRDTLFVALLGMVPLGVLASPLLTHGILSIWTLIGLILASQTLLSLLRLPLIWGGRHTVLLSVLLAGTWSGAAMAAIH